MKSTSTHHFSALGTAATGESTIVCDRVIDDFTQSTVGRFPSGWRARDEDHMEPALTRFIVEEQEGRRVLHATYSDFTVTIGRLVENWDLTQHPILEWQWKAIVLPHGGDESRSDKNDSTASVYAIWRLAFPMMLRGIRYAWSSTLPVGTHVEKRMGHDQILVMESGAAHVGTWRTVRVNVLEHYRQLFETSESTAPDGIALTTDADATGSSAEAFYADFKLCRLSNAARHG